MADFLERREYARIRVSFSVRIYEGEDINDYTQRAAERAHEIASAIEVAGGTVEEVTLR